MNLIDLLHDQDGLVHREQAVSCGMSTSAIDRRLARGEWLPVYPRVYRAADRPFLPLARIRAGWLWAGPGATVVGASALAWWRMVEECPAVTVLAVDPGRGHVAPEGIRLVRRAVGEHQRAHVQGLPVLHRGPALLEAAAEVDATSGARLVDRALQDGRVGVEGLREALEEFGQRHGVVAARRLVALAEDGARSEAERLLGRGLRRAGLRGLPNFAVTLPGWGTVLLDIAFPERRLVVEVDGWAYHRQVDRFRRDAQRQTALAVAGWRVLRVTWYDLVEDLDGVVSSIAGALALAG